MFAGIKRLLGIHNLLDNNEENIMGRKKRPEWEREDGTINKEKQEQALKEIKLHRAYGGKSKGGYKKSL